MHRRGANTLLIIHFFDDFFFNKDVCLYLFFEIRNILLQPEATTLLFQEVSKTGAYFRNCLLKNVNENDCCYQKTSEFGLAVIITPDHQIVN